MSLDLLPTWDAGPKTESRTSFSKKEARTHLRISGNTRDLKKKQLLRLRRLSERRSRDPAVISQPLARELGELSSELGRLLALLLDRQGNVFLVIVGDAHRIFIPELPRSGNTRLRGLRLVRTDFGDGKVKQEDIYDLSLLRLDYLSVIRIDKKSGIPLSFQSCHILPGASPGYAIEDVAQPGRLPGNFLEILSSLEEQLRKEGRESRQTSGLPRALLVGVYTPEARRQRSPEESIAELRELCATAGVEPLERHIIQKRNRIDSRWVIGSGKAREIAIEAVQLNADMIVFDLEISAAQASRLSAITDLKILDRTQLILDIFARNATSRDGKLQVELAQLNYLKGRLGEKDDNMSRLTGGIGGRGPGETKLEIGRRRVSDRIHRLERELASLKKRRSLNRSRRKHTGLPVFAIVGYTNAGKSSLLNALTRSEVIAEDRLFATLDTSTRRLRFPKEREVILSDTVGFIHDLPPELERAFAATLEELHDASLLLHCIDASSENREQKIRAVHSILGHLGLSEIPMIYIYNKSDKISEKLKEELSCKEDSVVLSARTGEGLDLLLAEMLKRLPKSKNPENSFLHAKV